jgi:hypothetical protein
MVMEAQKGGGDERVVLGSYMFWIYADACYNTKR